MIHPLGEPHQVERVGWRHWSISHFGRELDVLAHRQAWDEVVELKDEAHVSAPVCGQGAIVQRRELAVTEPDLSCTRAVEPAQQAQQRRLPAARRPQQDNDLAVEQVQVDAAQGMDSATARFIYLCERTNRIRPRLCRSDICRVPHIGHALL
jgi:hypothetical protein